MIAAAGVFLLLHRLVLRRSAPLFDTEFHVPTRNDIDRPLVVGSALFGIGWGMIALCPDPVLAALESGHAEVWIFLVAMITGMYTEASLNTGDHIQQRLVRPSMAKMTQQTRPLHDVTNTTDMKLQTLQLGDIKNPVYLIEDAVTRRMAVIDPAWDVPAILEAAGNAVISDILVSHWHEDHTNGINELVAATGAKVHLLQREADFWNVKRDTLVCCYADGNTVQLGSLNIQLLHTPGYTGFHLFLHG